MSGISGKEAIDLLRSEGAQMYELFAFANAVRIEKRGLKVNLCSVVNAKSGLCNQDCRFCAQSKHNDSVIDRYALIEREKMVEAARKAAESIANRFGIVTSGLAISDEKEIVKIEGAIADISDSKRIKPCASLGKVSRSTLTRLKQAGLTRYHCNIETAKSFFPNICTTRDWQEAVNTIQTAKEVGLKTCSGGIIGMGESLAQRVEFLEQVRDMDVDSVPLNFLNPIKGTKVTHLPPLTPLECLKFIAVARLIMPDKEIRVCGGREHNLGDLQSWALISGADGLMVGGYLTTTGRNVADDLKMIRDAGFEVASSEESDRAPTDR